MILNMRLRDLSRVKAGELSWLTPAVVNVWGSLGGAHVMITEVHPDGV